MSAMERIIYQSPFGAVGLVLRHGKLASVEFDPADGPPEGEARGDCSEEAKRLTAALDGYFAGREMATLEITDLDLLDATAFQRRVLRELLRIPFGRVVTYGQLAERVGSPGGARAVGQAVGRNPVALFVPCHRVVAAGGRLGGFGGGLAWKRRLLRHEGWTVRGDMLVEQNAKTRAERVCVYAGSFDPPTMGHMFMIERGAALFDRLIVAVGINPNKHYTFTVEDRLAMLRECTKGMDTVEVDSFEGQFLARYAEFRSAQYVLRGIRTLDDYRFEHAMRNVNEDLAPSVTTVFLIPPREICEVSSSFVKGLVGFEGWQDAVRPYVPPPVYRRLLGADIRWTEHGPGAEGGSE